MGSLISFLRFGKLIPTLYGRRISGGGGGGCAIEALGRIVEGLMMLGL